MRRLLEPANDISPEVIEAADEACEGLLSDLLADTMGRLELLQREAWARELGLDPATADLLALPPVPRAPVYPDVSREVLRAANDDPEARAEAHAMSA